jgi:hypothetical protein
MEISYSSSSYDVARIATRLTKIGKMITAKDGVAIKLVVRRVMEDYVQAVTSVMGVVDPTSGGNVYATPFLGVSQGFYFAPLSERTMRLKSEKPGYIAEIWAATGRTKEAVKVKEFSYQDGHRLFAGISATDDPTAHRHALRTEYGVENMDGSKTPRALFHLINDVFTNKRQVIVDEIAKLIRG